MWYKKCRRLRALFGRYADATVFFFPLICQAMFFPLTSWYLKVSSIFSVLTVGGTYKKIFVMTWSFFSAYNASKMLSFIWNNILSSTECFYELHELHYAFVVLLFESSRFLGWRSHWVVIEDGTLSWYRRQWDVLYSVYIDIDILKEMS